MTQARIETGSAPGGGIGTPTQDTVTDDAARILHPPVVGGESVAVGSEGAAADSDVGTAWPAWAHDQLSAAVALARRAPTGANLATLLYREWYAPPVADSGFGRPLRPLTGVYRSAHAGTGVRRTVDGISVLARHDVVAADGWWRTWGESWTPPRERPSSVRVLLTPRPGRLPAFVRAVTSALLDAAEPWTLACSTDPRRMRRPAGAVLQLGAVDSLPSRLIDELEPLLLPVAPPLCLPIVPGAALALPPTNGMTFGEHRCHLIALALRHPCSDGDPLGAIAAVFAAHGVRPAAPWRSR